METENKPEQLNRDAIENIAYYDDAMNICDEKVELLAHILHQITGGHPWEPKDLRNDMTLIIDLLYDTLDLKGQYRYLRDRASGVLEPEIPIEE